MAGLRRLRVAPGGGGWHGRFGRVGRGEGGISAVEFALVAPLTFLLLLGIVITGLVVTNQIALTNAVRTAVRAAALCGSDPTGTTMLPDGATACTSATGVDANVDAYITSTLQAAQGSVGAPTVTVLFPDGTTSTSLADCRKGSTVIVSASFAQPLYAPLIGRWLGDNGGNSRTVNIKAEATCEQ